MDLNAICPHCRQLRQDYQKFVERNSEILTVGPEDADAFTKWWHDHQMPFIGIPDPKHDIAKLYKQEFKKCKLRVKDRREFEFDAVSEDKNIVVCISTSAGTTSGGKIPTAKIQKIRSDVLWYYMLPKMPSKPVLAFSEKSMLDIIYRYQKKGRFPKEFELIKVNLPNHIARRVTK